MAKVSYFVTFRQACNGRNFSEAMDEEPGLVKRQP